MGLLNDEQLDQIISHVEVRLEAREKARLHQAQRHESDVNFAINFRDARGTLHDAGLAADMWLVDRDEPAREQPMLDTVIGRIQFACAQTESQLDRIYGLGNRIYGPQPEGNESMGRATASEPATMDRVFLALARLDDLNQQLDAAIARITGLA